ncbi:GntR family transcriptional regulator [Streptomyces minutiscleroticus]|uniref:GntR family transcriptional regulator n=1 Tax=Streptomyces minutiscleroticus TaxID=68238 RepID=A0A918NTV5_9ACTN|nr:GntR family transcriptional regulator [Streptomyces minutiscleroticus]GGX94121.1 GntR family transcriptional regulator [Streptomyces minutiscleroticus]
MEQAGPRDAHRPAAAAPAGRGAPQAGRGADAAARPRPFPAEAVPLPAQPRAADRERGTADDTAGPGGSARAETARGEHTHGEPALPRPRAAAAPQAPGRPVVQRASVRAQILDALRAALVAGELEPGAVYSAPALGESFGVSATPVREAMQQLALEGAVEVVPNRGFRIVERDARELAELTEIRALVEVPVILRLARTVPAARWAELRPLAEATVRAASAGDRTGYAESDRAFHRAVLTLSGNRQLVRIADDLHRRTHWLPAGVSFARSRTDLVADAAEHAALLDALIAENHTAVHSLLRGHFGTATP